MTDVILLDAGPLGMISHPRASVDIVEWLARLVTSLNRGEVVVASSNPGHIARFVPAQRWQDIPAQRQALH